MNDNCRQRYFRPSEPGNRHRSIFRSIVCAICAVVAGRGRGGLGDEGVLAHGVKVFGLDPRPRLALPRGHQGVDQRARHVDRGRDQEYVLPLLGSLRKENREN